MRIGRCQTGSWWNDGSDPHAVQSGLCMVKYSSATTVRRRGETQYCLAPSPCPHITIAARHGRPPIEQQGFPRWQKKDTRYVRGRHTIIVYSSPGVLLIFLFFFIIIVIARSPATACEYILLSHTRVHMHMNGKLCANRPGTDGGGDFCLPSVRLKGSGKMGKSARISSSGILTHHKKSAPIPRRRRIFILQQT